MPAYDLLDIPEIEIVPGFFAKFVHTEHVTVTHWRIEQDAALPEHSHPHEQTTNMVTGELELTVDGVTHHLKPGMVFVIPSNAVHTGRALTNCQLIEVFYPIREDYRDRS